MKNKKGLIILILSVTALLVGILCVATRATFAEDQYLSYDKDGKCIFKSFSGSYSDSYIRTNAEVNPINTETTTIYNGAKKGTTTYKIGHSGNEKYSMSVYVELSKGTERDFASDIQLSGLLNKTVTVNELISQKPDTVYHEGATNSENIITLIKFFNVRYTRA